MRFVNFEELSFRSLLTSFIMELTSRRESFLGRPDRGIFSILFVLLKFFMILCTVYDFFSFRRLTTIFRTEMCISFRFAIGNNKILNETWKIVLFNN